MNFLLRPATPADYALIHAMNEAAAPAVSNLSPDEIGQLALLCCDFTVAAIENQIAGFMMAMPAGVPYQSLNYQWFAARYEKFVYIDRIAVPPEFKGRGIGRALYENIETVARPLAPALACEVNIIPRNQESLAFHAKLGFVEVGQQDTEGGKKRVSLLIKKL